VCSIAQVLATWRVVDVALEKAIVAGVVRPSTIETISPPQGESVYILDLLRIRYGVWAAVLSSDGRRGLMPVECLATAGTNTPRTAMETIDRPLHEYARSFLAAWVKVPGTRPVRLNGIVHPGYLRVCEAIPGVVNWDVVSLAI
jgi:hypothetical protein